MSQASLARELQKGLVTKVNIAVAVICSIGIGLHIAWSIHARSALKSRIKEALAYTFQEPVRNHDLITMQRTIQAFRLANEGAQICVKLPDGTALETANCNGSDFSSFPIPLSSESFQVGVELPLVDLMSLSGIPLIAFVAVLMILVATYLRNLSRRITQDLNALSDVLGTTDPEFEEIRMAQVRIREGIANQEQAALGKMAAMVAHDIRSPLTALDMMVADISALPEDQRSIIHRAVNRIKDISNNLLASHRSTLTSQSNTLEEGPHLVPTIVEEIVSEKRFQLKSQLTLSIENRTDETAYNLFSKFPAGDLRRIISNLINNASEALPGQGTISVATSKVDEMIQIHVRDSGKGIPKDVIPKLMQSGATFGKRSGNGLGLYHAKTRLEEWNGSLSIQSGIGQGTQVTIEFPLSEPPSWFCERLEVSANSKVIILDDDPSIHQVWQRRFESLSTSRDGIDLVHFTQSKDLAEWHEANSLTPETCRYLIDYELIGDEMSGLSLIESLGIQSSSILVTSRSEDEHVQAHCKKLGVQLIPKGMAGVVPIVIQSKKDRIDCVLIDDDDLVYMLWKSTAKSKNKTFERFRDGRSFLSQKERFDRSTPIFIDVNLGDGIGGEEVAQSLHESGFTDLYFATGLESVNVLEQPWIRGVVDKSPPSAINSA